MKRLITIIILLLLVLNGNHTFAQESKIDSLEKVLKSAKKENNQQEILYTLTNIGDTYSKLDKHKKAIKFYKKAIKEGQKTNDIKSGIALQNKIGNAYSKLINYEEALISFNSALEKAKANNLSKLTKEINLNIKTINNKIALKKGLEEKYEIIKNLKAEGVLQIIEEENTKSKEEISKFLEKIEQLSVENQLIALKLEFKQNQLLVQKYEVEKNEIEIALLNKDNELTSAELAKKNIETQKQKVIIWFGIVGLLLLTALAFFIYRGYLQKQKANELLTIKNGIIEAKNKEITDSIKYAKRIQEAILISSENCNQILPQHFILFKPKDIVSGDFYWAYNLHDNIAIWAVADCTGHGVPGALMSMIGNNFLNEIVIERGISAANDILNELKRNIIKALRQTGATGETRDGMDAGLCIWHKDTNILEYAGAHNPLYLIRKNIVNSGIVTNGRTRFFGTDLAEFRADKQPIGYQYGKDKSFTHHSIQLQAGDSLYLFSDGYPDQFGGEKDKKFSYKRFRNLLLSFQNTSMDKQQQILDETIENWRGNQDQIDDICVIGVRV